MAVMNKEYKRLIFMAKALGFTESLRQLSPSERQRRPSASLGNDYNNLRSQIAFAFPGLGQVLPPVASIEESSEITREELYELYVFAEQIYQILDVMGNEDDAE